MSKDKKKKKQKLTFEQISKIIWTVVAVFLIAAMLLSAAAVLIQFLPQNNTSTSSVQLNNSGITVVPGN